MSEETLGDGMDLLLGGAPTAKFPTIGTVVKGKVLSQQKRQKKDIDGKLQTWDDGSPVWEIVFTLQTDDRDPEIEDDDGARRLFAGGWMLKSIGKAIREAKWSRSLVGGTLAVKFTEEGKPPKPGYSKPKYYKAKFEAPDMADVFEDLGAEPADEYAHGEEPF